MLTVVQMPYLRTCVASLSKCYERQCDHNEPFQAAVIGHFC